MRAAGSYSKDPATGALTLIDRTAPAGNAPIPATITPGETISIDVATPTGSDPVDSNPADKKKGS